MKTKENQLSWMVLSGSAASLTVFMLIVWNLVSDEGAGFTGVVITFVIAALAVASLWAALVWGSTLDMRLKIAGSFDFDIALEEYFSTQWRRTNHRDIRPFTLKKHEYLSLHGGLDKVLAHVQKTGELPGLNRLPSETTTQELDLIKHHIARALDAR